MTEIQRLSSFPFEGGGGNPAGVVLNAEALQDEEMMAIAKEVGYSETAFLTPLRANRFRVRYFSPELEVDFCGHATIAAGVALGELEGAGRFVFETNTGDVEVEVAPGAGAFVAELTSASGQVSTLSEVLLNQLLAIFGWSKDVLSTEFTPMISNAGNSHPVLVLKSLDVLASLHYDFDALQQLTREHNWPTVQLIARESSSVWRSRNPFAFGGVFEDPATGSSAAAFAVFLRETGNAKEGDLFTIKQGFEMGQPCLITVRVADRGAKVSGTALKISQ